MPGRVEVARELHPWRSMVTTDGVKRGAFRLLRGVDVDAAIGSVFGRWSHYEELPRLTSGVRRVQRIDARRVLWDVDIAGRQVVWEARILECVPEKLIRWESRWGACHSGLVRFEALPGDRTHLAVEIEFQPQGWLERLGARLGLVDAQLRRDLDLFRRSVERLPQSGDSG